MIKNEIWILADNRIGTFSQSIGLAEELNLEYRVIKLSYSLFSYLPNFILSESLLRIKSETRNKIKLFNYLPKIIFSAGRRSAPVALALKKLSQNKIKVIQIMNPNLNFSKFDLVILPKHDEITKKSFPNLVTTIGALNRIDQTKLNIEISKFSQLQKITKTKIALMIGGSSTKTIFEKDDAITLAKIATKIAKNMNATLLILTSRRTKVEITKTITEALDCDFKIFDWQKISSNNPYLAIVGIADFFIVTGDSVSMISECASTGKPIYIFDQKNISTKKHRRFHQDLLQENYARKLSSELDFLEKFTQKKLQETKRVAAIIKNKIA